MVNPVTWQCKHFDDLTVHELYSILQLRSEIFVVEQQCIFQDMDGHDRVSHHVIGWKGNVLVAHTRLLPAGVTYEEQSIGRVVVKQSERATGLGKELMEVSAAKSHELYGNKPIKIGAQLYLKNFYESLGYMQCSDVYDDVGIDHIKMIKQPVL